MSDLAREIIPINIEDELKQSYIDYAMSVIVGRALPDVRDGLKPVHLRVLFAMSELNNDWNKAYKKSARVVGDVIGKYHPHGESAVYDTIVRMAQPFSMRYLLVDGQGNFGSVDGDSAAAMRYTEVRMTKLAHALLADLDKETVDFTPNYDGNEMYPLVLPTRVPNLLVNGSSGIAVGMATNIPPHNLAEVIDAVVAMIDNPAITVDGLIAHIPGPDFPTGAIINGRAGIVAAYKTGRGRIYVRAKTNIETDAKTGRQAIIITELPYQVNKARLIEKIAELVKERRIEGISALRDESDKDGMRVVIELKRGEVAEVIENNLFNKTVMQTVFGINIVALADGRPKVLNLQQVIAAFIRHRREVVTRRTIFELRKARERAHLLEGLGIALSNIDPVISLIKQAKTPAEAKQQLLAQSWPPGIVLDLLNQSDIDLCRPDDLEPNYGFVDDQYQLSPAQAQAILDLRLHRLTGLEQDKIISEFKTLLDKIRELFQILSLPEKLMRVIRDELLEVKKDFADPRRTLITDSQTDFADEDLITPEDVVVTLSHDGYVKTQPLDVYQAQRRGGRGKSATGVKDSDFVEQLLIANTHDTVLCFSSIGKVYWLRVYRLPQGARASRGKPIVNLLPLQADEKISAILPVSELSAEHCIVMATQSGIIKRVAMKEFSRPRSSGIIAIDLGEDDSLIGVSLVQQNQDIMLFTDAGKAIRFTESTVRCVGRTAKGVRGVKLDGDQKVISLDVIRNNDEILTVTQHGYGKRTKQEEYRQTGRGGVGVIAIQVNERNGKVVGALQISEQDELMLISDRGTLVRTRAAEISIIGRNTQGVRLINLSGGEQLVGIQKIVDIEEE